MHRSHSVPSACRASLVEPARSAVHQAIARALDAVAHRGCPSPLRGRTRLLTCAATYEFVDALCTRIEAVQGRAQLPGTGLAGMTLLGWLTSGAGHPEISPEWMPGCLAVLVRREVDGSASAVALTSSTVFFAPLDGEDIDLDFEDDGVVSDLAS